MSKLKSIKELEMERALEPNFGKGITVASGFDLGAKAPLDSRLTVKTIEERNAHVTGNRAYEGMLVYVEADKKTYQLINNAWEEFGFNEEKFQQGVQPIVEKNAEQDERLEVLESLVVGGEGEGLGAVIEDVAKNKADIVNLQSGLAEEVTAREEADALINAELDTKASQADLQAEITRATQAEQGLSSRIDAVVSKATNNENAIQANAQSISKEVQDRKSEITRVEGVIADEVARAEAAEQELQANIDTKVATTTFESEKQRVNGVLAEKATKVELNAEKERVDGLFEEVNTSLDNHKTLIDSVTELANENKNNKADKVQVAKDIQAGVASAKGYADEKLVEAKSYSDSKLVEGKSYTDAEIDKVEATIDGIDKAYKAADAQVLADAKAHANKAVADLVDGAPEALNTLKELADALSSHENEYDALLATVGTKANASDVYTKTQVDGIKSGLETSISGIDKAYKAADTALDGRLKTVEDLVNGDRGIEAIQTDLSQNKEDIVENAEAIQVCETNITKNSNAIALETTNRTQAIEVVTGKVTQESERALAAETVLDGKISQANTEIETAKGDITKNADAIVQEASNRAQAVSTLDTKLNNMTPVTSSSQPVGKSEGHIWIEILD